MNRLTLAGLVLVYAPLALTGCGPSSDQPAAGPIPPADAPAGALAATGPDYAKPINALGTEPFWAVDIRPDQLKLSGPDRKDLVVANPGARVQGETAVWEGAGEGGATLKVTLLAEACNDGMSDLRYPYRARVETSGEMLTGCAAPLDAWPKKPVP